MDNEQLEFLTYWFSGFTQGLEQIDETSQDRLLKNCGLACAQSYTAEVFRVTYRQSKNLPDFFLRLAEKFPEGVYDYIDEHRLTVHYKNCACDLVKNGWVKSPVLCKCSQYNLQQNLEAALGRTVQVELKSSILGGAAECLFEVRLE